MTSVLIDNNTFPKIQVILKKVGNTKRNELNNIQRIWRTNDVYLQEKTGNDVLGRRWAVFNLVPPKQIHLLFCNYTILEIQLLNLLSLKKATRHRWSSVKLSPFRKIYSKDWSQEIYFLKIFKLSVVGTWEFIEELPWIPSLPWHTKVSFHNNANKALQIWQAKCQKFSNKS